MPRKPDDEATARLVADYATHLARLGRSPATIAVHDQWLRRIGREIAPLDQLEPAALADWLANHPEWKDETRRSLRSILAAFGTWNDTPELANALPAPRRNTGAPRPVSDADYHAALAAAAPRQSLAIRLGALAGLRIGEVARVNAADLFDDLLGTSLVVHGKGGKDRIVPLADAGLVADLRAACASNPEGWAFPNVQRGGHIQGSHLARTCRPLLGDSTFHALRHRFATRAYRASKDIRAVQLLLGHSSSHITEIYVAVADDDLRRIVLQAA